MTRKFGVQSENVGTGRALVEQMLIRNVKSGNYLVGGRKGGGNYCEVDHVDGWYVNQCPLDPSDDGFVWLYSDGKLQNKKTKRWLFAEPWSGKTHEYKDNSEIVDWDQHQGTDCIGNKCYNWEFVKDGTGRIKHMNSGFYLCASSWGEHPDDDDETRVLAEDHPKNKKQSDYPNEENPHLIGFQWTVEAAPCTPKSLPGTEFFIKNLESGNYLVGGRTGGGSFCGLDHSHGWYLNQCPYEAGDDGFVWFYSEDGKLQNKKTQRWLFAEPLSGKTNEYKDNCEIVDWNAHQGADCVDNKCYNWEFVNDGTGRIKHVHSGFYLCASSWGENPDNDDEVRVIAEDHPGNKKQSDYPDRSNPELIGFQWEPVCTTPSR